MRIDVEINSHAQAGTVFLTLKGPFFDCESGVASVSLSLAARDGSNDKIESETEALIEVDSAEALAMVLQILVKQARYLEADHAL